MSLTGMRSAEALTAAAEALGATVPNELSNLIAAWRLIDEPAPVADPMAGLLDAAAAGLDPKKLQQLITEAAAVKAANDFRGDLAAHANIKLARRFARHLRDGAADALLDSIRPGFTAAADQLAAAAQHVGPDTNPAQLATDGTPDQLDAWRAAPTILRTLDRCAALAAAFGPEGTFELIKRPDGRLHAEGTLLHPRAVMCTTGDLITTSAAFHQPHPHGDTRTSPWWRVTPHLNTTTEAAERVRAFAEAAFDAAEASRARGYTGNRENPPLDNPYRADDQQKAMTT